MPKHAVNTSERARIRKLFLAGNNAEAIAAHMNIDLQVVKAWHPDNVGKVKAEIREAEAEMEAEQAVVDTKELEDAAAAAKRSEAGRRAAATRKANRMNAKEDAKEADRAAAEERERVQKEQHQIAEEAASVSE
jgi:hypothetical protein